MRKSNVKKFKLTCISLIVLFVRNIKDKWEFQTNFYLDFLLIFTLFPTKKESTKRNIDEVVNSDKVFNEQKIYQIMDLREDMEDITNLKIDCEGHPEAKDYQDDLRKANVSLVDLKAYLGQIDCAKFANAIINEFLFKVRILLIFNFLIIFTE